MKIGHVLERQLHHTDTCPRYRLAVKLVNFCDLFTNLYVFKISLQNYADLYLVKHPMKVYFIMIILPGYYFSSVGFIFS